MARAPNVKMQITGTHTQAQMQTHESVMCVPMPVPYIRVSVCVLSEKLMTSIVSVPSGDNPRNGAKEGCGWGASSSRRDDHATAPMPTMGKHPDKALL